MCIAAWGVYQTVIGHYVMAPISSTVLLVHVNYQRKIFEAYVFNKKGWRKIVIKWIVCTLGTCIPLYILGYWYTATALCFTLVALYVAFLSESARGLLTTILTYSSESFAGSDEKYTPVDSYLATFSYVSWIGTSLCFEHSLYFTPGLFLLLIVVFFGTRELRAYYINDLTADFSDENEHISLNKVQSQEDPPMEKPGLLSKVSSIIMT